MPYFSSRCFLSAVSALILSMISAISSEAFIFFSLISLRSFSIRVLSVSAFDSWFLLFSLRRSMRSLRCSLTTELTPVSVSRMLLSRVISFCFSVSSFLYWRSLHDYSPWIRRSRYWMCKSFSTWASFLSRFKLVISFVFSSCSREKSF